MAIASSMSGTQKSDHAIHIDEQSQHASRPRLVLREEELRAAISHIAKRLSALNEEPGSAYGLRSKDKILSDIARMNELAQAL